MNRTINTQNTRSNTIDATPDASRSASQQDAAYEVLSVTNLNADANAGAARTVEVLYQRLGSRWYAFSMIGDEVYFSQVDASEAERRLLRDATPSTDDAGDTDATTAARVMNGRA